MIIHSLHLILFQMHRKDKLGKSRLKLVKRKGYPYPKKECHLKMIIGHYLNLKSRLGPGLDQQEDQDRDIQDLAQEIEHNRPRSESRGMALAKRGNNEGSMITRIRATEAIRNPSKSHQMTSTNLTEWINTRKESTNIQAGIESTVE